MGSGHESPIAPPASRSTAMDGLRGLDPAVPVVRGAGTLRRHHRRAERTLGRAAATEGGTFVRLLQALEDEAADALAGLFLGDRGHVEAGLRVKARVALLQCEAALRDFADSAPLARRDPEDLA